MFSSAITVLLVIALLVLALMPVSAIAFQTPAKGGALDCRMRHKKTGAYILAKKPVEVKRLEKLGYRKKATAFRAFA